MNKPILTTLLTLFMVACNNGVASDNTTDNSHTVQHNSPLSEKEATDWTPLFKYLETEGCGHSSPELRQLLESLYDWEIDDRGTNDPKDDRVDIETLKTPIPPKGFEHAVGQQISYITKDGSHILSLPIQGSYHGIPVKALERYGLENSDVSGIYLILDMPLSEVKTKLRNVHYAIPIFESEDEGMGLFDPIDFQAFIDKNNNGETVLSCVYF